MSAKPSSDTVSRGIMRREILILAAIIAITLSIYIPNTDVSFNNWDMDAYRAVLHNGQPLDMAWRLLVDSKGHIVTGYYSPLSSISLMLDKVLVGSQLPQPKVTIFVNLLVHILNGVLLFYLLRAVGADMHVCATAMLIFLIHPVQVASVMWFAQRKTVMAATFYFVSYLLYLGFRESKSASQYGLSILSLFLGLLCKPTVAVLPLALAATEILLPERSRQLRASAQNIETNATGLKHLVSYSLIAKIAKRLAPYALLVIVFSWLFMQTEQTVGMQFPLLDRPFIAAAAIWFYVGKILAPIELSVIYPRWEIDATSLMWWIPLIGLVLVIVSLMVYHRKVGNNMLWGLANFVVPLLTSIGFVAFGYFQYAFVADHFLYLSMAAAAYLIAIALHRFFTYATKPAFYTGLALTAAYFSFLGFQTYSQTHVWANSITLWETTIQRNPACWAAYDNLGNAMLEKGDLAAAEANLRHGLELHPNGAEAHVSLGLVLVRKGDSPGAVGEYRKALAIKPDLSVGHSNLAAALMQMGRLDEAEKHCKRALEINPDNGAAYVNLGLLKKRSGNLAEAVSFYRKALKAEPYLAEAHHNLAVALDIEGDHEEAIAHYRQAVVLSPNAVETTTSLADSLFKAGQFPEAIKFYEKALELGGNAASIHNRMGAAYAMSGEQDRAISHFQASLRIEPNNPDVKANLERVLQERGRSGAPGR